MAVSRETLDHIDDIRSDQASAMMVVEILKANLELRQRELAEAQDAVETALNALADAEAEERQITSRLAVELHAAGLAVTADGVREVRAS